MKKVVNVIINVEEKILNSEECAELLGFSKRNMEEKFRNGEIPAHKKHGKWFALMSEIIEHIRTDEE